LANRKDLNKLSVTLGIGVRDKLLTEKKTIIVAFFSAILPTELLIHPMHSYTTKSLSNAAAKLNSKAMNIKSVQ
jgi:hypothetical protein